jgi:hypothetical protein
MKIINYISMILALCRKFMSRLGIVVCGDIYLKYGCLEKNPFVFLPLKPSDVRKSFVESNGVCRFFEYASDFIWWLGKNNFNVVAFAVFPCRQRLLH